MLLYQAAAALLRNQNARKSIIFYEDNHSAITMAIDQSTLISNTIREQITKRNLELKYSKSTDMVANIMTKGLAGECFEKLRLMTGLQPMIEHTESEKEC